MNWKIIKINRNMKQNINIKSRKRDLIVKVSRVDTVEGFESRY